MSPPAVGSWQLPPTSWVSGTWSSGTYPQQCHSRGEKKNANKLPGGGGHNTTQYSNIFLLWFLFIVAPISKSDGRFFHTHGPLIRTTSEQSAAACQEFPKNHRRMNSTNCSFFRKICGQPGFKTKNTCPCSSGLLASRAKSGSTMTSAPKCWAKIEAVSMQLAEGLRIRHEGRR